MSLLTLENSSTAYRDPAIDFLSLRIKGGGLDGRVVKIASPKCTIGSGPRCTLRIVGPGIRPLHCLIVRGSRGLFIRRWSPDTRLNGGLFEDAALREGDRLSVGPVDLDSIAQEAQFSTATGEGLAGWLDTGLDLDA